MRLGMAYRLKSACGAAVFSLVADPLHQLFHSGIDFGALRHANYAGLVHRVGIEPTTR